MTTQKILTIGKDVEITGYTTTQRGYGRYSESDLFDNMEALLNHELAGTEVDVSKYQF